MNIFNTVLLTFDLIILYVIWYYIYIRKTTMALYWIGPWCHCDCMYIFHWEGKLKGSSSLLCLIETGQKYNVLSTNY